MSIKDLYGSSNGSIMFCSKGGILECVLWNWKHIHALRPMVRHCMEMLIWNGHTPHFLLGPLKPV